jgi:hypothetical protein
MYSDDTNMIIWKNILWILKFPDYKMDLDFTHQFRDLLLIDYVYLDELIALIFKNVGKHLGCLWSVSAFIVHIVSYYIWEGSVIMALACIYYKWTPPPVKQSGDAYYKGIVLYCIISFYLFIIYFMLFDLILWFPLLLDCFLKGISLLEV